MPRPGSVGRRLSTIRRRNDRPKRGSPLQPNRDVKDTSPVSKPNFPDDGIDWHGWNAGTLRKIVAKDRPVLVFVIDPDPTVAPFMHGIVEAVGENERLCQLLRHDFVALFMPIEDLPNELAALGAGRHYHLGIVSPSGFTPMMTFPFHTCTPSEVVEQMVVSLERLLETW